MYRRTKFIADNLLANKAEENIGMIRHHAKKLYNDYQGNFHQRHLQEFLQGIITKGHFATILRAQLLHMRNDANAAGAKERAAIFS